ncbi:hypothetical protein ACFSQ0_10695 [Mesonia sediminis]|uniref:Uncharacterized protein n=1 Tax=Mesonia sediminis TaxID=1703946 RepID=A0ABW5SH38_9FLAO
MFHILNNINATLDNVSFTNQVVKDGEYKNNTSVKWREKSLFNIDYPYAKVNDTSYIYNAEEINSFTQQDSLKKYIPPKELGKYKIEITSDTLIANELFFEVMTDLNILKKIKD